MKLKMRYPRVPQAIRPFLQAESIEEVHIGCSNTRVYKIRYEHRDVYLKTHSLSPHFSFAHEVHILKWLFHKLPVPEILEYETDARNEYLVLSAIPGENCVDVMNTLSAERIVSLLAEGLQQIHALDIADCPFDEQIAAKLKRGRYRVEQKLIDESDFDDERLGMTAGVVYSLLVETIPPEEDLVFSHGDYCLPNILVQNNTMSGFIDLDRAGISDRYNDLAIASRSIAYNLGPDYEQLFFECYGLDSVDPDKITYYRMMDELF